MTYEYICTACAHAWEAEQSISAEPLRVCPSCGAEAAKRQVSGGAGFILKGGGWYADLYGSPKPGAKADGASESKPSASSTTKSESSSDSKSPSTESKSSGTESKAAPAAAAKPAPAG